MRVGFRYIHTENFLPRVRGEKVCPVSRLVHGYVGVVNGRVSVFPVYISPPPVPRSDQGGNRGDRLDWVEDGGVQV